MSNIIELENCPELNFIENMTLQETEDQMRELYAGYYRELTGRDPEIGNGPRPLCGSAWRSRGASLLLSRRERG